ncbi:hypothetical protein MNAN1_003574 [Malassezia nana]|uniref:Sld7 C-terminal domain-containing protein n=1 Tax=Malassezia nana TaxID=180528 RepID=A0AAF0ETK7_9BASI|nr:hypothetical protein MNAN1_003574 [Malassezia nana]
MEADAPGRLAADGAAGPVPRSPLGPGETGMRVLWKGALVLLDGTHLPGASIVTSMQPWTHLRGTHATEDAGESDLEAEAELCFALEMVRHHPLRARPFHEPMARPWSHTRSSPADVPETSCRASGAIQMQVDGADDVTQAFFLRLFGMESALRPGESTRQALHLTFDPSARSTGPSYRSGAVFELVLVGRCALDGVLDLVVGRQVGLQKGEMPTKEERPDDPLPRVASDAGRGRLDSKASSYDDASVTRVDMRMRRRGQLPHSPRQARGHTPGRRGEKRSGRLGRELARPMEGARSPAGAWRPIVAPITTYGRGPADPVMEQQNRARIKKLVQAQLTGRGIDRSHSDHGPCFQMAYAGTCLVFRHTLDTVPLESAALVPVITAHLDMYINPAQLALCAPVS